MRPRRAREAQVPWVTRVCQRLLDRMGPKGDRLLALNAVNRMRLGHMLDLQETLNGADTAFRKRANRQ